MRRSVRRDCRFGDESSGYSAQAAAAQVSSRLQLAFRGFSSVSFNQRRDWVAGSGLSYRKNHARPGVQATASRRLHLSRYCGSCGSDPWSPELPQIGHTTNDGTCDCTRPAKKQSTKNATATVSLAGCPPERMLTPPEPARNPTPAPASEHTNARPMQHLHSQSEAESNHRQPLIGRYGASSRLPHLTSCE